MKAMLLLFSIGAATGTAHAHAHAHAQGNYGPSDPQQTRLALAPDASQSQADTGSAQQPPAAPAPGDDAQALAKQLANPVASLISVPFQWNVDFGGGSQDDGVKVTLNIQPVVPISIAPRWNMIVRTILPIIYQGDISSQGASQSGLGDTTQSFFFSPRQPGPSGIIWAVGPALLYPTATNKFLGGRKWGVGPTAIVLKQAGKSSFGMLVNHIWSIAGDDDRADVSSTFLQPFFSYTTATATTYGVNTETSYDWKGNNWLVPINLTVSQLIKLGEQPLQIGLAGRYYVVRPDGGPNWGIRMVFTLLFPKK